MPQYISTGSRFYLSDAHCFRCRSQFVYFCNSDSLGQPRRIFRPTQDCINADYLLSYYRVIQTCLPRYCSSLFFIQQWYASSVSVPLGCGLRDFQAEGVSSTPTVSVVFERGDKNLECEDIFCHHPHLLWQIENLELLFFFRNLPSLDFGISQMVIKFLPLRLKGNRGIKCGVQHYNDSHYPVQLFPRFTLRLNIHFLGSISQIIYK